MTDPRHTLARQVARRVDRRPRSPAAKARTGLALLASAVVACGGSHTARSGAAPSTADAGAEGVLAQLSAGRLPRLPSDASAPAPSSEAPATASDGPGRAPAPNPGYRGRYRTYQFRFRPPPGRAPQIEPEPYEHYRAAEIEQVGTITGTVSWRSAPMVPPSLRVAQSAEACGPAVPNESLLRHHDGGVANTVVYLQDITSGRDQRAIDGALERSACRFRPHVQLVVPIGGVVRLANRDDHTAPTIYPFGLKLGPPGSVHELQLYESGMFEVLTDRVGDPSNAWLIVPKHPYYAITDDRGQFRLDQVPPGKYRLAVWHEPVILGEGRRVEPTAAPVPVEVRAGREVAVTIKLATRSRGQGRGQGQTGQ
jgi:hypothetical protein